MSNYLAFSQRQHFLADSIFLKNDLYQHDLKVSQYLREILYVKLQLIFNLYFL